MSTRLNWKRGSLFWLVLFLPLVTFWAEVATIRRMLSEGIPMDPIFQVRLLTICRLIFLYTFSITYLDLETIPTSTGKKLFASGFWGVVRHPNYLGSIHCNLSFALFCWSAPPVIGIVLAILGLIGRTYRLESRCKLKYGAAWDRYCAKVKYALIPKIY